MTLPDWQLPSGVDRGLWEYMQSPERVLAYDEQIAESPLSRQDVAFCEQKFDRPGRMIDLGCGTGRLCMHFARKGYECWGVDLSDEMLARARARSIPAGLAVHWVKANLVELSEIPNGMFDYAASLFSTLGMIRGPENRQKALQQVARVLRPGGRFVLHVHNRYFPGLGWRRVLGQLGRSLISRADAGDITMPQPVGAPLTLHHFSRRGVRRSLVQSGFEVRAIQVATPGGEHTYAFHALQYGYLIAAERGADRRELPKA